MSLQLQRLSDYATPSSTRPGSRDELSKVFISACVKNRDNLVICRVVGGVCASYTGRLAIRATSKGIDFARDVNTRAEGMNTLQAVTLVKVTLPTRSTVRLMSERLLDGRYNL